MKNLLLLLFALCFSFYVYPQKYVKVWGDEFNTPGLPDDTKWDYEIGKIRNSELQYYTYKRSENARIQDTVLIIEARKEAYQGASYTSASLISKYKGDWQYGKFEIRAKVPTGKGTWPAIWMMPTSSEYGGWPRSGEIDIMEYVGMNASSLYFNAHFGSDSGTGHKSSGNSTTVISQPYNKFITFALVWTPDKLEWYADGIKYHTYTKTTDDFKVWPFDKMFYFILNLAYGGSWGAQQGIDDTKLPHKFYIDYVRVYQLQESAGPFSLKIEPANGGTVEVSPLQTNYPEGTQVTLTAKPDTDYEFDKWLHVGSANPLKIDVSKNLNIIPVFKKKNELIVNGDFNSGLGNWGNFYFYSAQQKATATILDGVYILDVTAPGTDTWHIVDQQLSLPFILGYNYRITFDAWAENPGIMNVFISKNYGDYGNYYSTNKSITAVKQSFSWIQKMDKPSDLNCRFGFGFGKFTGKVYLDNVSIQKIIPTNTDELAKTSGDMFDLFPNPASGQLDIVCKFFGSTHTTIKLYNLEGKLISVLWENGPFVTGQTVRVNLNEAQISNGVYFINISSPEISVTRKLIINRI